MFRFLNRTPAQLPHPAGPPLTHPVRTTPPPFDLALTDWLLPGGPMLY